MLMDETGKLVEAYHEADGGPERLSEYLDSTSLLDVAAYPEKRYATRYICEDGSTGGSGGCRAQRRAGHRGGVLPYFGGIYPFVQPVRQLHAFRLRHGDQPEPSSSATETPSSPATTRRSSGAVRMSCSSSAGSRKRLPATCWCISTERRTIGRSISV